MRELATRYAIDLGRVIAMGHSAGGQLACWIAARHRIPSAHPLGVPAPLAVAGAISLAGCLDLRARPGHPLYGERVNAFLGGTPAEVPERYAIASPRELLPLGLSQVLFHGTADDRVPYEISRRYAEDALAAGDDVELITLPESGHFNMVDPRSHVWPSVADAVQRLVA